MDLFVGFGLHVMRLLHVINVMSGVRPFGIPELPNGALHYVQAQQVYVRSLKICYDHVSYCWCLIMVVIDDGG